MGSKLRIEQSSPIHGLSQMHPLSGSLISRSCPFREQKGFDDDGAASEDLAG